MTLENETYIVSRNVGNKYQTTLRNIPEEQRAYLQRGASLTSRKVKYYRDRTKGFPPKTIEISNEVAKCVKMYEYYGVETQDGARMAPPLIKPVLCCD
jgi:hypothetical protein